MSRRLRRTKIVTTLGPATDRDNNLEKVIAAGANVVRMNFSHGTPEDHQLRADKVREIAAKLGRRLARDAGCDAKIVAKVERAEAVCDQDAMDDVILASDVVMVARGDLGVEIGDPELVGIQKALIRRARQLNRSVITATQMMESMITNPMPTRAEVMDVANAVLDGTDAVMLSAETAAGQYPSETVAAMARVCLGAEKIPSLNVSKHRLDVQFDNVRALAPVCRFSPSPATSAP